jgi:hypothetical protein
MNKNCATALIAAVLQFRFTRLQRDSRGQRLVVEYPVLGRADRAEPDFL